MNEICQLSNDVNFINEHKQENCGNESAAFDFFKAAPPLSCRMVICKDVTIAHEKARKCQV